MKKKQIKQTCNGCEKPASPLKKEGDKWLCGNCLEKEEID